ncbi:hypothetical protein LJC33_01915 [Eubacteriales bacterium OttesenSCG-928-N13]|nr:hypothetical protein [Eubacteriales bacterium OttesenSCG-928-N13]
MMIISVIAAILVLAFYLSMNAANIYVLLSDGMKQRTAVILTRDPEDASELNNFFMKDFLENDEALRIGYSQDSPYLDYNITGFDSEVTLEWVWSWPWDDVAQATIVHKVPSIRGTIVSGKSEQVKAGTMSASPPSWHGGRYNMQLYRSGGQWKIAGMVQTQVLVDQTPIPNPTLTPTAQP